MAAEEITVESLRQLLRVQTELRDQAEDLGRKAQRALVRLLETVAPEIVDQRLKNAEPLDHLPVDELEGLIRHALSQARSSSREPVLPDALLAWKTKANGLQAELDSAIAENQRIGVHAHALEIRVKELEEQIIEMHIGIKIPTPLEPPNIPQTVEPEWMTVWRSDATFQRDSAVLRLLGETGLARRPVIEGKIGELLNLKRPGGSVNSLLERLKGSELVQVQRPWKEEGSGLGGRWPDLISLTEKGSLAYWLITGNKPVENEMEALLPRHVTYEHAYLNLVTFELLREMGMQVNPEPAPISLPGGGAFMPDLAVIEPAGSLIYVEVERDANKEVEQRQVKWRNFYQACSGKLYVICENRTSMRNLRSEINFALGNLRAQVYLTNLVDLQAGKRGVEDCIWLEVKGV